MTALKMSKTWAAVLVLLSSALSTIAQSGMGVEFLDVISSRSSNTTEMSPSEKRPVSSIDTICPINKSLVAKKILIEYGALFVAAPTLKAPPTCLFRNESDVAGFQSTLKTSLVIMDGIQIRLQKPAADSLNAIVVESLAQGVRIRPLDGAIAGGRSYWDTVRLWNSRLEPALLYWVGRKRISIDEAAAVKQMSPEQQIEKVIDWESQGMRFGTHRRGSIFASTAPPGASQHLSLLAIDIAPPLTPTKIALMNSHGWYQTVKGDRPHFTYLGLMEKELPGHGLKALLFEGAQYWIPNMVSDSLVNP